MVLPQRHEPDGQALAEERLGRGVFPLRIQVNRELANLQHLLRMVPAILNPGGVAAIISFHSGEDRLVKAAFREGLRGGVYEITSREAIRPSFEERRANPRSRSAKLRWAQKTRQAIRNDEASRSGPE